MPDYQNLRVVFNSPSFLSKLNETGGYHLSSSFTEQLANRLTAIDLVNYYRQEGQ